MLSAFDSLRLSQNLIGLGLSAAQADEIANVLRAATQIGALDIARKGDIERLGGETRDALSAVQRNLAAIIEDHDLESRVFALRRADLAHLVPGMLRALRVVTVLAVTAIAIELAIAAALAWFWFEAWPA